MTETVKRFLKYTTIGTNSDLQSPNCPSTPSQIELGKMIAEDLKKAGMNDVIQDEHGYIYGFLPGSGEMSEMPAVGFISHMDTSSSVPGDNIRPSIIYYQGGEIVLEDGKTKITPEMFPDLKDMAGMELIVTDGRTLLGSDDKAGVAEIVGACEKLANSNKAHRPVAVAITPDEEIGRGADLFDFKIFRAGEAYTVDGGPIGEIEFENFNAASFKLIVHGINIHPGSAKDRMKNAVLMANQFISMLPPAETPSHTEGYEGFFHVNHIEGDETRISVAGLIRDHDRNRFERRKAFLSELCNYLNYVWGFGSFELTVKDSYYNMKEKIMTHFNLIETARIAFEKEGITPKTVPIRGGTDGARLSYEGLPCPNLSTGGYGFHSCVEFIPVSSIDKMVSVLVRIAESSC